MGKWGNLVAGVFTIGMSYSVQPLKAVVFSVFSPSNTPVPIEEIAQSLEAGLFYLGSLLMAVATLQILYHFLLDGHKKQERYGPEPEPQQQQQRPGPQQSGYDARNPENVQYEQGQRQGRQQR